MVTGNNYRFGHKVWVDILVEEKKDVEMPEEVADEDLYDEPPKHIKDLLASGSPGLQQNDYPDLGESVHDKMGGNSEPCSVEDLMKSVSRTPKEVYEEKVATEKDATKRKNLMTLFNLGFVNFEVNSVMLQKYCNNVETVAAHLCEGMLSESCINAVFKK